MISSLYGQKLINRRQKTYMKLFQQDPEDSSEIDSSERIELLPKFSTKHVLGTQSNLA